MKPKMEEIKRMSMKREFSRKQYDKVRKLDHHQMTMFFNEVYDSGYEKGLQDGEKKALENMPEPTPAVPDLTGLDEFLQNIKGVGGAKARVITEAVTIFLERKAAENEENRE